MNKACHYSKSRSETLHIPVSPQINKRFSQLVVVELLHILAEEGKNMWGHGYEITIHVQLIATRITIIHGK